MYYVEISFVMELIEEYGPEIVYIKGIHNTVAETISRLEYDPSVNKTAESYLMTKVKGNSRSVQRQNWLTLSKLISPLVWRLMTNTLAAAMYPPLVFILSTLTRLSAIVLLCCFLIETQ